MKFNLSLGLRIFSIVLFSFTPTFLVTLLATNNPDSSFLQMLKPDIRGTIYQWDFELMFVAIYLVWAFFLWKASRNPEKHGLFIDFTIWANIAHGLVMILIGVLSGEFHHLLFDGLTLILPSLLLIYLKRPLNSSKFK